MNYDEWNIEELVEQACIDLNGEVPMWRIREVVIDLAARYSDAKVRTYVPLFIRRETVEKLGPQVRHREV